MVSEANPGTKDSREPEIRTSAREPLQQTPFPKTDHEFSIQKRPSASQRRKIEKGGGGKKTGKSIRTNTASKGEDL